MFPSGQDPYDPNSGQGGVPSQRGLPDFNASFEAQRPDAPMPKKVSTVRTLMFIGGACGLLLSLLFIMGMSVPNEAMTEVLDEQAAVAAEQDVDLALDAETMRSLMLSMALVTGLYGIFSTLLAARLPRRTVGVYWGAMVFQGLAGLLLGWNLFSGDLLAIVPLGFTVTMMAFMWDKESRAHYGLL
ncbi:hypothetical protein [Nocardiopsis oceani]